MTCGVVRGLRRLSPDSSDTYVIVNKLTDIINTIVTIAFPTPSLACNHVDEMVLQPHDIGALVYGLAYLNGTHPSTIGLVEAMIGWIRESLRYHTPTPIYQLVQ